MLSEMLLALALSSLGTKKPRVVLQERRFEVGGAACVFEVVQTITHAAVPGTAFQISCDGKRLYRNPLGLADVGNVQLFDDGPFEGVLLAVPWERGVGIGLSVIRVKSDPRGSSAGVVFEQGGRHGAEVFDQGQLILRDVGFRIIDGWILPSATNVYKWQDDRYVFERSYTWNPHATWADRYCILMNPKTCPAEQSDKRALDEYEKPPTP